jgi:ribosomal protein L29
MLAKEIRVMDIAEIDNKVDQLQKKIYLLRQQVKNRQVEDLSLLKKTRRDVSRLLTVRSEKVKEAGK